MIPSFRACTRECLEYGYILLGHYHGESRKAIIALFLFFSSIVVDAFFSGGLMNLFGVWLLKRLAQKSKQQNFWRLSAGESGIQPFGQCYGESVVGVDS